MNPSDLAQVLELMAQALRMMPAVASAQGGMAAAMQPAPVCAGVRNNPLSAMIENPPTGGFLLPPPQLQATIP